MDAAVLRSIFKWPEVPAVYGWLHLDRRGNWRLRAGRENHPKYDLIGNTAVRDFIARNYDADERGCWFFQNGPQRVFVSLAYAPLVFRSDGDGFVDHCGRAAGEIESAWLDQEGSLVLQAATGIGLMDDRDLGSLATDLAGGYFPAGKRRLPLGEVIEDDLERLFGFTRVPRP